MRNLFCVLLLGFSVGLWAQNSSSSSAASPNSSSSSSGSDSGQASSQSNSSQPGAAQTAARPSPNLAPPRSDSVNASSLEDAEGMSSSKDTQIDLSPPPDDDQAHPLSSDKLRDESGGDVSEFHPWDPHKAAKDVEVGDFYFKRKNYRAAEDRYREALLYKDNDATATYRLAVCLEKMDRPEDARAEFESYLKILPHGPEAERAQKAIDRLKESTAAAKPVK
ncbi:MAG TPA: tetratricopeptide repeat protein [Candidatus Sulfotelmatobacter sp.]|nr:tetratricopeptide repeat protein [Candidatus Sulfotelmatobacter sp.]